MRSVAILAVLVYHFELSVVPNGFIGVDIFFVISGYVVCRSLTAAAANHDDRLVTYLEHFYRRRFWRLIPALAVMVATTLILTMLFIPPSYLSRHIVFTAAGAMTGVANLVLAFASGANYFDQMTGYNPLLHTWSLGVEEQFYVILPFVIRASTRRRHWASMLAVLAVLSFAIAVLWSWSNPVYAFYTLPARFWELAAGALAYRHAAQARRWLTGGAGLAAGWTGMATVLLSLAWPVPVVTPFPGAILPTLGMVLVLWFAAPDGIPPPRRSPAYWLSGRAVVYVGKISYSLYLWHWPVVVLMRWTIGFTSPIHAALASGLSFALAMASYHFVELPFQTAERAQRPLRPARFVAIAACLLTMPLAVLIVGHGKSYSYARFMGQLSVVQRQFGWSSNELPDLGRQVPPAPEPGKPSLILIGDSHAGHLAGVASAVAAEAGLGLRVVGGCAYFLLAPVADDACRTILDGARKGDVVVFSSLNVPRYVDQDGVRFPEPKFDAPEEVEARGRALAQFLEVARDLSGRGVAVVYRGPEPLFHFIPLRCSDWFNRVNPICAVAPGEPRTDLLARSEPVLGSLAVAEREIPGLVVWDVFDVLCPGSECRIHDDAGNPLYSDQDHLSGWGAQRLLVSFEETVQIARSRATLSP